MIALEPRRILRALLFPHTREPTQRGLVSLLDVLERYSFGFAEILKEAGRLSYEANTMRSGVWNHTREDFSSLLDKLAAECDVLGLDQTGALAARIQVRVREKGKEYSYPEFAADLDTVVFSFVNALRKELFVRVPLEREPYFQQDALLGTAVAKAFPSAADDIQHAGTCYALGQNTACVFHLMRVLERPLGVLAAKFSVDFEYKAWGTVIDQIEKAVKLWARGQGVDPRERQRYAEAASHLGFVKDAWRNEVNHVRGVYDKGQAESVLTNVRGFMQALAEAGLSEPAP